jgi:phosphate:Na+ symporter
MLASFLGGLALFLFGQSLLEKSLQKTSRIYLQGLIKLLTKHKGTAILAGTLLAVGMQSSTVPVFTLIGLINRGVIQLGQAVSVVLGASIGTTITIQAISFDIAGFALWFVFFGFLILKFWDSNKGKLIIGFGFLFYGIRLIGSGVALFKETDFGSYFLNGLCTSSFKNMGGAFLLTVISQSTLAALAVGIVLMKEGGFSILNVIPIILGAHLGAGILPFIYSWKADGSRLGRQLGVFNLIYRFFGVLLFLFLMQPLAKLAGSLSQWAGAGITRELANAHTIFVLATVCLFIPFVAPYTKIVKKFSLKKKEYLIKGRFDIDKTKNLELKLAEGVYGLLKDSVLLWEEDEVKEIDKIERQGLSLRNLEDSIWRAVSESTRESIGKEGEDVLRIITSLGGIRDIVSVRIVEFARNKVLHGLDFSIEGLNEVLTIHKKIIGEFKGLLDNQIGCGEIDKEINRYISQSHLSHIDRVCKGFRETRETQLLHTDAITLLEHIQSHIEKIVRKGD